MLARLLVVMFLHRGKCRDPKITFLFENKKWSSTIFGMPKNQGWWIYVAKNDFSCSLIQKKGHSQCSNPQTSHEPRRSCLGFLGLGDSTLASIADLSLGFSGSSTLWKNGFLRRRHCWEKKRVWNLRVYLQNDNHIRKWLMWLISGMYLGDKATKEHPHKQSNAPGRGTFSLWSSTNSSL